MRRFAPLFCLATLALAACHPEGASQNGGPQPATGNATEARPSGAGGTPGGGGSQT